MAGSSKLSEQYVHSMYCRHGNSPVHWPSRRGKFQQHNCALPKESIFGQAFAGDPFLTKERRRKTFHNTQKGYKDNDDRLTETVRLNSELF